MASPNRADRPGASAAQALFARNNPSLSSLSSSSAARNQHQSQNPHLYPHQVFRYPRAHILQPLSSYSPIPRAAITPTAPVVWNPVAPKNPYYPGTFAPTSPTRPVEPRPAFSLSLYLPRDAGDTTLIRAGYTPCYTPDRERSNSAEGLGKAPGGKKGGKRSKMAEPRARAARHKGQMNFPSELRLLLLAYGDPSPHPSFPSEPLPETVRVLDEIVTDFILEICHNAAQYANYSRRQKIKVDDFRFALRRDPNKLGRVQELLRMERELKEARKAFDQNDDQVPNLKDPVGRKGLEEFAESVDGGTAGGKKSKGKGKRPSRRDSDTTEETIFKRRKVTG